MRCEPYIRAILILSPPFGGLPNLILRGRSYIDSNLLRDSTICSRFAGGFPKLPTFPPSSTRPPFQDPCPPKLTCLPIPSLPALPCPALVPEIAAYLCFQSLTC